MEDAPVIYGLEDFQARALASQVAEPDKICFLVGTQSLTATNQVRVIEYDDDCGAVTARSYDHSAGEVWRLTTAPLTPTLLASVHCDGDVVFYSTSKGDRQMTEANCSVWRLPEGEGEGGVEDNRTNVELVTELRESNVTGGGVRWVGWSDSDAKMATLTQDQLLLWNLRPEGGVVEGRGDVKEAGGRGGGVGGLGVGRWYPHQQAVQVAATLGASVVSWDTRTMTPAWTVRGAHAPTVRDLDFNPNLQYHLATCGDDCYTRFWDLRKPTQPLLSQKHHSHWVWGVRYNASYDVLVLSCSSDQRVVLSSLPSVAATPFGEDGDRGEVLPEGVVHTYESHEDSVYCVEWAAGDFWTFASLSYDGRLVLSRVPRAVKYRQFL